MVDSIGGSGAGSIAYAALNSDEPVAAGAGALRGVAQLASQALAELARAAKAMGGTPGVSDANGAPAISDVNLNMSAEDMAAALQVLQGKTQEAQLRTAREGLKTNQNKLDEQHKKALDKVKEWIHNCEEAAHKAKAGGIFGWIKKIATFVASVVAVAVAAVATVATAGAGSPLFALAMAGLVGSTISLASQISQAAGGPPLEVGAWMAKGFGAVLQACGVPKDKADALGAIAVMAAIPGVAFVDPSIAGQAVGGFAQLVGADANQVAIVTGVFTAVATVAVTIAMSVATGGAESAKAVSDIANTVKTVGPLVQGAADVTAAAGQIGQGVITIQQAGFERNAANAQADKKSMDAVIAKLQQQMEEGREEIKKVMQEIMDGMTIVSQMINAAADNRSQITANLIGKAQTI